MYKIMVSTQRPLKGARNFPTLGFSHIIIYYFKIDERTFWMQTILYCYYELVVVTLGMHNTSY